MRTLQIRQPMYSEAHFSMITSQASDRPSGRSDAYCTGCATHPCAFAGKKHPPIRKEHHKVTDSGMGDLVHDTLSDANTRLDERRGRCTTESRPRLSVLTSSLQARDSLTFDDGSELGNSRVADWVKSQQYRQHIALPLDLFESMVDRLIASEEAAEQLRTIAITSIREACPVWRGPNGFQHEPPLPKDTSSSGLKDLSLTCSSMMPQRRHRDAISARSSVEVHYQHRTSDLFRDGDSAKSATSNAPRSVISEASTHCKTISPPPIAVQSRSASSASRRRFHGNVLPMLLGKVTHCKQQPDPISWFDCSSSSSEDSVGLEQADVCRLQYQDLDVRKEGMSTAIEAEEITKKGHMSLVDPISLETLVARGNDRRGVEAVKATRTSGLVSGLWTKLDRFLVKCRISRASSQHCRASQQKPEVRSRHDIQAFLQISRQAHATRPASQPRL